MADSSSKELASLEQLRNCIPKHCFERSFFWSFLYLIRDIAFLLVAGLVYVALVPQECPEGWLRFVWYSAQFLWSWIAGSICTGLWVVAHECGHHAFCTSDFVSDVVGYCLHTLMLVPFFSWQYTHARHHKNNNHLLDNETHVPATRKGFAASPFYASFAHILGGTTLAALETALVSTVGWPLYLFVGLTGCRRTPNGGKTKGLHTHFIPNNNAFHKNFPKWKVWISTFGCLAVIMGLIEWASLRGWSEVVRFYVGPYLVVNFWLVTYTWLHHTHPTIPHYGEDEWTWLKGAKATIDRDYGIYDYLHHDIGSTHVCHHTFSKLPHYHAREATECMKKVLKGEYNYCGDWWVKSWLSTAYTCAFVDGVKGVQYYHSLDELFNKKQGAGLSRVHEE